MFSLGKRSVADNKSALIEAINRSQAVIEFNMDGTIITANQNFLSAMGYTLDEVVGQHHRMFVEPAVRSSQDYLDFWASLNQGDFQSGEFKRLGKGAVPVWIQASYNPVMGKDGKLYKVVKFATDITSQKIGALDAAGQISAINRSQAVIEFNLDGTIISANDNFLSVVGYSLAEIQGKHHGMFVAPAMRNSTEYRDFWARLRAGEHQVAEYKRIRKDGKEVWILASYNPILDERHQPFKVVKFASDVTRQKLETANYAGQIDAIGKSQAVIHFNMDGTIIQANENFLAAVGYSLDEIVGQHHRMFVDPAELDGNEYREFWAQLNRGEYQASEYRRIGKNNKEIWIQASYNPILNLDGQPFKVVKYATDITQQINVRRGNERVCSMLESVAAGAEELNASVREISTAMTKSKDTTRKAVDRVQSVDGNAQRLDEASKAMSGIVNMISHITGQINLLALNATIESARAGEAGRGFAVVASEVKNLAGQAKLATEKISQEIENLRGISKDVVGALTAIRHDIQNVSDYVTSTADAIDQQSIVSNEISSSIQQAAAEAATLAAAG